MTKILYIPEGTYITFMLGGNRYSRLTTIIEEAGNGYAGLRQVINNPNSNDIEYINVLLNTDPCCEFRSRNKLPAKLYYEMFEVIYD